MADGRRHWPRLRCGATLRLVLNYVGAAIVEDACVAVEVRRDMVGDDGLVRDPGVRAELLRAVAMLGNGAEDLRSL